MSRALQEMLNEARAERARADRAARAKTRNAGEIAEAAMIERASAFAPRTARELEPANAAPLDKLHKPAMAPPPGDLRSACMKAARAAGVPAFLAKDPEVWRDYVPEDWAAYLRAAGEKAQVREAGMATRYQRFPAKTERLGGPDSSLPRHLRGTGHFGKSYKFPTDNPDPQKLAAETDRFTRYQTSPEKAAAKRRMAELVEDLFPED